MNEVNQFLQDTEGNQSQGLDILDQPLVPEGQEVQQAEDPNKPAEEEEQSGEQKPEGEESEEEQEEEDESEFGELKPRNRRERRLVKKLNDERESSKFLAGKVEAMSGAQKAIEESDYLKGIERIYGTDSPEAQMATDLLKKAIVGAANDAEERAYQRIATERQQEVQAEKEAQEELDSMIDDIEDTYGVTLSPTQERSYFQLLEKMSPKDRDGNVIGYADPHAVFEVFKDRTKKKGTAPKAKKLSSRSVQQGTSPEKSEVQDDVQVRTLKDLGII